MKTMKSFFNGSLKAILAAAVMTPVMSSCLDDGENTFGYNYGTTDYVYANTQSVSIAFQISGETWSLAKTESASWYAFGQSSGTGPFAGYVPVTFTYNNTGDARSGYYQVSSSDGTSFNGYIYQGKTRGDGSLGNAPLVSRISGTDGSVITLTYDSSNQCVATMTATKNGNSLYSYSFSYNTADTTMYVRNTLLNTIMLGKYNSAWAPSAEMLASNDTVEWTQSGMSIGASTRFTVERRQEGGLYTTQSAINSGISDIDDAIVHRSLVFEDRDSTGTVMTKNMTITLGSSTDESDYVSNQYQNIDVNQLLFGIDHCNPYLLVGMYRWMRCGYVYQTAKSNLTSDTSSYTVTTTLNSDKSISTMTVTDGDGAAITYTFEY